MRPLYVLGFLFAVALVWLVLYLYNGNDMLEQESIFLTALFLHTAMKIWLASEAGRQFFDDRKNNALELTLSTPLPVREILEGEFLALFRQFGPVQQRRKAADCPMRCVTTQSDPATRCGWPCGAHTVQHRDIRATICRCHEE